MSAIIKQVRPDSPDAAALIGELDDLLMPLYAIESRHGFSVQKLIDDDVAFFVIRVNGTPAGCGGIKIFGSEFGELKRMYVRPQFRGRGFGRMLVNHLAEFARSKNIPLLRLETGIHQHEAIALYEKIGFKRIPPFPPYFEDPVSRCYEMRIG